MKIMMNSESDVQNSTRPNRRPRILWANAYCLLDTSSGASMSVRQILLQLTKAGVDVQILGATHFDHERGTAGLEGRWDSLKASQGKVVSIQDGPLHHHLLVTASTQRNVMIAREESQWFSAYQKLLDDYKPDLVFYYGGKPLDYLIASEAKYRNIPVAFYLANGNYLRDARWFRDVDLILTDSHATAGMYQTGLGIQPKPVGKFIDATRIVANEHMRKNLLFINPSMAKGAGIVAQLALMMEDRRPDIIFEVVESRGSWQEVVRTVSAHAGTPRDSLRNVILTSHTTDMRPVYARARLLLVPSLWWESGGRVLAEAMLNGIPAIVTARGGNPEMIGDGGIKFQLPEPFYEKPYSRVPKLETLAPLVSHIEALYDDEDRYADLVAKAQKVGRECHSMEVSTKRLINALVPWLAKRAGDRQAAEPFVPEQVKRQDQESTPAG